MCLLVLRFLQGMVGHLTGRHLPMRFSLSQNSRVCIKGRLICVAAHCSFLCFVFRQNEVISFGLQIPQTSIGTTCFELVPGVAGGGQRRYSKSL